jgi:hypothetical protein
MASKLQEAEIFQSPAKTSTAGPSLFNDANFDINYFDDEKLARELQKSMLDDEETVAISTYPQTDAALNGPSIVRNPADSKVRQKRK